MFYVRTPFGVRFFSTQDTAALCAHFAGAALREAGRRDAVVTGRIG